MAEEEENKEYRWETGYEKTWEGLQEDKDGFLKISVADIVEKAKKKRRAIKQNHIKLGMMRHIFIVLDCSSTMSNQDLKPNRFLCILKLLENFIKELFDQNPISQMGIILMHNKRAEKLSDLSGNFKKHIKTIDGLRKKNLSGEPSLQNALELALKSLQVLPNHASREVLVIMGSLTTCDPGDIHTIIDAYKHNGVRCSVIGLAAEVYICRQLANQSKGTYDVILDETHLKELLYHHVDPPPAEQALESNLIKMGFPHQMSVEGAEEPLTMCMCHVDITDEPCNLNTGGYYCPQCFSKYCELPIECRVCTLTLVSAPHLARSFHHLFPAKNYNNLTYDKDTMSTTCFACQKLFKNDENQIHHCPNCLKYFCTDCDNYVHDILHTCPGCATNLSTFQVNC